MYDAASLSDAPTLQRAVGELRVALRVRDGRTVLAGLRQAGCLKARFPLPEDVGWLGVVTLNTSGGIAGGDVLTSSFQLEPGAQATIASQAAERFYRAMPGSTASVRTRIEVADGAAVEWLPQETILFDRTAVDRRLDVELASDACFLGVESLVFGRAAMGETVHQAQIRDAIRIRRGGHLLLQDAIRMNGEIASLLAHRAVADGMRTLATIWYVGLDADAKLAALRANTPLPPSGRGRDAIASRERVSPPAPSPAAHSAATSPASGRGVEWAASAWNGMLVARFLAPDSAMLRTTVMAALGVLRDNRPLPRVWLC